MADGWRQFANVNNLLQMSFTLQIAGIVPAKETALFAPVDGHGHRANPQRIGKGLKTALQCITYTSENVSSFQGIAFGANAPRHLSQQGARLATLGGNGIPESRHFAGLGKTTDKRQGLFDSQRLHGRNLLRFNGVCNTIVAVGME